MKNIPTRHDLLNLREAKLEAEDTIGHALEMFLYKLYEVNLVPETQVSLTLAVTTLRGEEAGKLLVTLADLQIETVLAGPGEKDTHWELRI